MKKLLSSIVIVIVAVFVFSSLAVAGPRLWEEKEDGPGRFKVLDKWDDDAVLDKETGLLWERSPSAKTTAGWFEAHSHCNALTVGNRLGWRLPTLQELASLVDPSVPAPGPTLPSGHPFINVQSSSYWSATTFAFDTRLAWVVSFSSGAVTRGGKGALLHVWCVRGGQGVDPQ